MRCFTDRTAVVLLVLGFAEPAHAQSGAGVALDRPPCGERGESCATSTPGRSSSPNASKGGQSPPSVPPQRRFVMPRFEAVAPDPAAMKAITDLLLRDAGDENSAPPPPSLPPIIATPAMRFDTQDEAQRAQLRARLFRQQREAEQARQAQAAATQPQCIPSTPPPFAKTYREVSVQLCAVATGCTLQQTVPRQSVEGVVFALSEYKQVQSAPVCNYVFPHGTFVQHLIAVNQSCDAKVVSVQHAYMNSIGARVVSTGKPESRAGGLISLSTAGWTVTLKPGEAASLPFSTECLDGTPDNAIFTVHVRPSTTLSVPQSQPAPPR